MQTPGKMQAVHVERFKTYKKSRIRDAMAHPLSGFLRFYTCDLSHTFAEW